MAAYLEVNRPRIRQFASRGNTKPTGLTVIHTAESVMDNVGPDTGAENVARFIQNRTNYGSYHDIADSDSNIQLVEYWNQAYQDGTGSNPYAMSISFALATTDWRKLTREKLLAFIWQGAFAFGRQQKWLRDNGYPTTPLRRITREQSSRGMAGLISHAERDPDRRSDPGIYFPWNDFVHACHLVVFGEDENTMLTAEDIQAIRTMGIFNGAIGQDEPFSQTIGWMEDRIVKRLSPQISAVNEKLDQVIAALNAR